MTHTLMCLVSSILIMNYDWACQIPSGGAGSNPMSSWATTSSRLVRLALHLCGVGVFTSDLPWERTYFLALVDPPLDPPYIPGIGWMAGNHPPYTRYVPHFVVSGHPNSRFGCPDTPILRSIPRIYVIYDVPKRHISRLSGYPGRYLEGFGPYLELFWSLQIELQQVELEAPDHLQWGPLNLAGQPGRG